MLSSDTWREVILFLSNLKFEKMKRDRKMSSHDQNMMDFDFFLQNISEPINYFYYQSIIIPLTIASLLRDHQIEISYLNRIE